jgi:hypothetical protein
LRHDDGGQDLILPERGPPIAEDEFVQTQPSRRLRRRKLDLGIERQQGRHTVGGG